MMLCIKPPPETETNAIATLWHHQQTGMFADICCHDIVITDTGVCVTCPAEVKSLIFIMFVIVAAAQGHRCLCQPGWAGPLCHRETDECESQPCMNGAACVSLPTGYR